MTQVRASIDIGSNSILLLIGEFSTDGFKRLVSESRVTSLGFELDQSKEFHKNSMKASLEALKEYSDICNQYGLNKNSIIVTATEASRVALNAESFYLEVEKETGLKVKIISSEAEAYYSAKGILFDTELADEEIFILDIGGASSEVIKVNTKTKKVLSSYSMPMGGVRATNWIKNNIFDQEVTKIIETFKDDINHSQATRLFCVAGTMTSVANMFLDTHSFNELEVHGMKLTPSMTKEIFDLIENSSAAEILRRYPFLGKRSKSIVGGLRVANLIFNLLAVKDIQISTYGLRYGTLLEGSIKDEFIIK